MSTLSLATTSVGPAVEFHVRRLCDTIAAAAQPEVQGDAIHFKWGQHIFDDRGDNVRQFGLHGTAQAVLALAAAERVLRGVTRYERFTSGGNNWLLERISSPKKPLDQSKTLKVAEHLHALARSGASKDVVAPVLARLLSGQGSDFRAWSFDVRQPKTTADAAHHLPTIYALHALIAAPNADDELRKTIDAALDFCLTTPITSSDSLTAATLLFGVCGAVEHYVIAFGDAPEFKRACEGLLKPTSPVLHSPTQICRFEYRIDDGNGSQAHAFANLPVGLMWMRTELFAQQNGLAFDPGADRLRDDVKALIALLSSADSTITKLLSTCSATCRLLVDHADVFESVAARSRFELPPPRPVPKMHHDIPDPLDAPELREELYCECLASDDVATVSVLMALTGGRSGARTDLCQVTNKTGVVLTPEVMKLDTTDVIAQEIAGAKMAADLLPPTFRVNTKGSGTSKDGTWGLLRYEYAGGKLIPGRMLTLLDYVHTQTDVNHIATVIASIFTEGMAQSYKQAEQRHDSFETLRQFFNQQRGGHFWEQVVQGIEELIVDGKLENREDRPDRIKMSFPWEVVENVLYDSETSRNSWKAVFPHPYVPAVHGDLNPRNILMVREADAGPYQPVLIDYHRYGGKAPLAIDFARLEVGLQVKGLARCIDEAGADADKEKALRAYEAIVNASDGMQLNDTIKSGAITRVPAELMKVGHVVAAIRQSFKSFMVDAGTNPRAYFATLILSYLSYVREPYRDVLSSEQRSFALYSASKIFERFF